MKKLFCIILCLLLAGCRKAEPLPELAETPSHIYREVSETVLIDCEIADGCGGVMPKTYEAQIKRFNDEQIIQFLGWNHKTGITLDEDSNNKVYHCDDGSFFAINNDYVDSSPHIGNFHCNLEYLRDTFWPFPFTGGTAARENGLVNMDSLFMTPVDMPFATAQEAEQQVRYGLSLLGVDNLRLEETLYIPHERMADMTELMQQEPWSEYVRPDYIFPEHKWTELDDCYRFEFRLTLDGMDMSYRDKATATFSYVGAYILVYYTPSGIIQMNFSGVMEPIREMEDMTSTVSAERAIEIAAEFFENRISESLRTVISAEVVYSYRQDGERWLLCPVWEIIVLQEPGGYSLYPQYHTIHIDPITGNLA